MVETHGHPLRIPQSRGDETGQRAAARRVELLKCEGEILDMDLVGDDILHPGTSAAHRRGRRHSRPDARAAEAVVGDTRVGIRHMDGDLFEEFIARVFGPVHGEVIPPALEIALERCFPDPLIVAVHRVHEAGTCCLAFAVEVQAHAVRSGCEHPHHGGSGCGVVPRPEFLARVEFAHPPVEGTQQRVSLRSEKEVHTSDVQGLGGLEHHLSRIDAGKRGDGDFRARRRSYAVAGRIMREPRLSAQHVQPDPQRIHQLGAQFRFGTRIRVLRCSGGRNPRTKDKECPRRQEINGRRSESSRVHVGQDHGSVCHEYNRKSAVMHRIRRFYEAFLSPSRFSFSFC